MGFVLGNGGKGVGGGKGERGGEMEERGNVGTAAGGGGQRAVSLIRWQRE